MTIFSSRLARLEARAGINGKQKKRVTIVYGSEKERDEKLRELSQDEDIQVIACIPAFNNIDDGATQ
jgi:muramoyltetrapeptide carboxypeptidase LdcA involved in peptidoglycan recycling